MVKNGDNLISFSEEFHFINEADKQFEIAKLGQLAITATNLDLFLEIICERLSQILSFEYVKILLLDSTNEKLNSVAGVGWKGKIAKKSYIKVDTNSQISYTLKHDTPIVVKDYEREKRFKKTQLLQDHDVKSGISVKIPGKNHPYGVLGIYSQKSQELTSNDISFCHSVAYIISSTITSLNYQKALIQESEKYQKLMENSTSIVLITDLKGNILEVNPLTISTFQYSEKEILSMHANKLLDPHELKNNPLSLRKIVKGGIGKAEQIYIKKDGTTFIADVTVRKLTNETLFVVLQDITERKHAEQELRIKNEQIRNATKMEAIGRVAGGVAHDFNNYLTVISGYSDRIISKLQYNPDMLDIVKDANQIKKSAVNAALLTRELLYFSSHKHQFKTSIINVNEIISDIKTTLESLVGEKIRLNCNLDPKVEAIKSNYGQIQQMILNLVINSKDAINNKNGIIEISTGNYKLKKDYTEFLFEAKAGDYSQISVKDNGSGMTEEIKEHIFEPFFTTKKLGHGTGLGLSSIYGFVKDSGGFMKVNTELNKGTQFCIYFPSSKSASELVVTSRSKKDKTKEYKQEKTILVADDNTDIQLLLKEVLQKEGFTVLLASNGKQAIDLIDTHQHKIDLIISDVVMPEMDGLELFKKASKISPSSKIILISGYSRKEAEPHVDENDIIFLQKPFSIEHLLLTINSLI